MDRIRAVTWLAPGIPKVLFERVCDALHADLGVPVSLESRTKMSGPSIGSLDPFAEKRAELGFLCGPAAVPEAVRKEAGFELLGLAPVFDDDRYGGEPTCFCDLVVREDCLHTGLEGLQNLKFGFNDKSSLSGWLGLSCKLQQENQEIETFFGEIIQTGGHLASIKALRDGRIDVASIDSNVLRTHAGVLERLKVIDSIGPWPSQPVVVRTSLHSRTKRKIGEALSKCGPWPDIGFVGFAPQSAENLERVPSAREARG